MKRILCSAILAILALHAQAQEEASANGVVTVDNERSMSIRSKNGSFEFKPYLMVQSNGSYNWYDDEGLDKAYNQDNVANSGFALPYAILGFTGKAYDRVHYNLSINAAATGAQVLQQAWFDLRIHPNIALRAGVLSKTKCNFSSASSHTF